jgi:vancomycin resistance protein VanW
MDQLSGRRRLFVPPEARGASSGEVLPVRVCLRQRILASDYLEAKLHNLRLGTDRLKNLPIPPAGILSFWHVVGRPAAVRGFQPGRSLLAGELRPDYGGGLCQLAGLIYHLSLLAGLEVVERHPHSRDIYEEEERYAPLGADASVAYGFKDLRVRNTIPAPISFQFSISPDAIEGELCSAESVEECAVEFVRLPQRDGVTDVETHRKCPGEARSRLLDVSSYRRL